MARQFSKTDVITYDLYTTRKWYGVTLASILKKATICRHSLQKMEEEKSFPRDIYIQLSKEFPILFPKENLEKQPQTQLKNRNDKL